MSENADKRVAIYITPKLHKAAKTKTAELDTSFQQVLAPYLEKWTYGDVTPPTPAIAKSDANAKYYAMLERILGSDDARAREFATDTLSSLDTMLSDRGAAAVKGKGKKAG